MEEPEGMVEAPTERLLKEIIKGVQQPQVIEITDDMPVKRVKNKKKQTLPATPAPGLSGIKTIPKGLSGEAKRALRNLGWIEGQDSPKGVAKSYKKLKKTKVGKLKEGWEPWTKPAKRGPLDCGTDEED